MSVNDDRINEAMRILRETGQTVVGNAKRVNNNGDQIRTRSGAVVNLWDKGTVSFQGNAPQKLQDALAHLERYTGSK